MQPPEKSHPYLSMQPASEILRSEDWDSVKPILFENLVEGLTPPPPHTHTHTHTHRPSPPAEREEGCKLWSLFQLKYGDTIDMSTII